MTARSCGPRRKAKTAAPAALARGNAHQANQIRTHFASVVTALEAAYRRLASERTDKHESRVSDEERDERDRGR